MGIYEHFAAKGINPVLRTGFISSATGSGHVITCTARRWVVSGRLYCFQRPPAEGGREACKPSTDPTSRITNVRINRTAAHRSSFPPILRCRYLTYTKYACDAAPRLDAKSLRSRTHLPLYRRTLVLPCERAALPAPPDFPLRKKAGRNFRFALDSG